MRTTLKASGIVVLVFALAGCATQSDHTSAPLVSQTQHSSSTLTSKEYALALDAARSEIRRMKDIVTSATVTVSSGKVIDSNIGEPCISGRLLNIKLFGDFAHIAVSHPAVQPGAPQPDYSVHEEMLTADAKTGRLCLIGVQIGKVVPDPGAESLPVN